MLKVIPNSLAGDLDKEQFQDLQYLMSGGMGHIYTAKDTANSCTVAIKFIKIEDVVDFDLLIEEVAIARTLSHPNIVKTYHSGEFYTEGDRYFYIVMEYLKRGSLHKFIMDTQNYLSLDQCFSFFYDILNALQEAHKVIIHRDLKPENMLISEDGRIKICDFGIAKYVGMQTRKQTHKGFGTFTYMAPECWKRESNTILMCSC